MAGIASSTRGAKTEMLQTQRHIIKNKARLMKIVNLIEHHKI